VYDDVGYAQNFSVGAKGGGERGWDCTWLRRRAVQKYSICCFVFDAKIVQYFIFRKITI